jgi:hypothetical protein
MFLGLIKQEIFNKLIFKFMKKPHHLNIHSQQPPHKQKLAKSAENLVQGLFSKF